MVVKTAMSNGIRLFAAIPVFNCRFCHGGAADIGHRLEDSRKLKPFLRSVENHR